MFLYLSYKSRVGTISETPFKLFKFTVGLSYLEKLPFAQVSAYIASANGKKSNWWIFGLSTHGAKNQSLRNPANYIHSFLQVWKPPSLFSSFLREPPPFWVPTSFWSKLKKSPPSFWQSYKLVHVNCIKHLKIKVLRFIPYKSIENIIIITLYTFRLHSAFTADTCFG